MNYTRKHHLPQWEETDRIMMNDFNAAMAGIETGIESVRTEASQVATELTKKVTAAQKTADTARTEAAQKPYVVGSYVGVAYREQEFKIGFSPSVVIGFANQGFTSSTDVIGRVFAGGRLVSSDAITITTTGFRIAADTGKHPRVNVNGVQYEYIAFR